MAPTTPLQQHHIRPRKRQQPRPQPTTSTATTSSTSKTSTSRTTTTTTTTTVAPGRSGRTSSPATTTPVATNVEAASSVGRDGGDGGAPSTSTRTTGGILRQRPKYSSGGAAQQEPVLAAAAAATLPATPAAPSPTTAAPAITGPIIERTRPIQRRSRHNGSSSNSREAGTAGRGDSRTSSDTAAVAVAAATATTTTTTAVEGYIPRTRTAGDLLPTTSATTSRSDGTDGDHDLDKKTNKDDNDKDDPSNLPPLVFHSLSKLLERAGTLPPQPQTWTESGEGLLPNNPDDSPPTDAVIPPGSLVEADLSFQVVDPETFEAQRHHHRGDRSDDNAHPCRGDDDDDDDEEPDPLEWLPSTGGREDRVVIDDEGSSSNESNDEDDPVDTEEFWQSLRDHRTSDDYYSDDDDDEDESDDGSDAGRGDGVVRRRALDGSHPQSYQNRPFLVLWKALSQWVTPEAVRYVRGTEDEKKEEEELGDEEGEEHRAAASPEALDAVDSPNSDLEAARCAGLSASLHLHFAPALAGLQCCKDNPRWARIRVDGLLRRFDYALPAPALDAAHLRALACILLYTALRSQPGFEVDDRDGNVPEPCAALGLSPPEYRCLTRALLTFGLPHDSDDHLG